MIEHVTVIEHFLAREGQMIVFSPTFFGITKPAGRSVQVAVAHFPEPMRENIAKFVAAYGDCVVAVHDLVAFLATLPPPPDKRCPDCGAHHLERFARCARCEARRNERFPY